tara:strand:+ start:257 stop:487 length:231 start_codon:yes stop_codon:yes gene_type:complete
MQTQQEPLVMMVVLVAAAVELLAEVRPLVVLQHLVRVMLAALALQVPSLTAVAVVVVLAQLVEMEKVPKLVMAAQE